MTARDWVLLIAATGHLSLALLATFRGGRSPLALPVALLCFDLFGWTFATFGHHLFGAPEWGWLDATATALSPPFVLHVVLAFIGEVRGRMRLLRATYAASGPPRPPAPDPHI